MDNQPIIEHILADTQELMSLKVDNAQVVKDIFTGIRDRVEELYSSAGGSNELYAKAFTTVQAAMTNEYEQFSNAPSYDERELALIELRHKAAEVSELIQGHQRPQPQE